MGKEKIKIGNAGGFWGDDLSALKRQIDGGELDYITSDYLAEITMGILMKQKLKNPDMGYVYDFLEQIEDVLGSLKKKGVRIITNAGGMNPGALAKKIVEIGKKKGLSIKVATVEGDDIAGNIDDFYPDVEKLANMETGEPFELVKNSLLSANVYLGVPPLVEALKSGADIIITGRATDTAITLAPMIYEFGWELNEWDKLASGIIGGHIIECGSQSTGGNFTDWEKIDNWGKIGFPVIEVNKDGTFYVTKHSGTGGIVSTDSVKEQLLYEMGNPKEYISPDVVADFTTISVEDAGKDRVFISGIKGKPSTLFLKVSASYTDGYKANGSILIGGTELKKKSEIFSKILWDKVGEDFEMKNSELLGADDNNNFGKAILRFGVYDHDINKINKFGKEISTLILSGPAGAAVTGGRPKPQKVIGYWPALIRKELINPIVKVISTENDSEEIREVSSVTGYEQDYPNGISNEKGIVADVEGEVNIINKRKVLLKDICIARSGDKGDTSNIGVIARNKIVFNCLKKFLTPSVVKIFFSNVCNGKVTRFEVKNLNSFNFLLERSLGGGGAKSVFIDAQGKLYAQELLNKSIYVDDECFDSIEKSLNLN